LLNGSLPCSLAIDWTSINGASTSKCKDAGGKEVRGEEGNAKARRRKDAEKKRRREEEEGKK
jgi:hypothetical protein